MLVEAFTKMTFLQLSSHSCIDLARNYVIPLLRDKEMSNEWEEALQIPNVKTRNRTLDPHQKIGHSTHYTMQNAFQKLCRPIFEGEEMSNEWEEALQIEHEWGTGISSLLHSNEEIEILHQTWQ